MKPRERFTCYSPAKENTKKSVDKSKTRKTMSFVEDEERTANQTLFDNLMSNPVQREMIRKILAEQKDNIEAYKKEQEREKNNKTPVGKMKRKFVMESPTSLRRRLALENQRGLNISPALSRTPTPSPVPFETVLKGITAFVEIITEGENRSSGCKNLLASMGAKVRDTFTSDVTHVIYKDGLFATYQKAKLMKRHLVSVLWVEEVRNTLTRAPEINFPVLGVDYDVNELCDKMQNEFDEIVKEEYRRSIGPSSQHILSQSICNNRRKTLPVQMRSFQQIFNNSDSEKRTQLLKTISPDDDDIVANSQDDEVSSILLAAPNKDYLPSSTPLPSTPIPSFSSESDPDFRLINGELFENIINKNNSTPNYHESIKPILITPMKLLATNMKNSSTSTLSSTDSTKLINSALKKSGTKTIAKNIPPKKVEINLKNVNSKSTNLKRRQTTIAGNQKSSTSSLKLSEIKNLTKSDSKVTRRKKLYDQPSKEKSVFDMMKDMAKSEENSRKKLFPEAPTTSLNDTKLDHEDMDITNVDESPIQITEKNVVKSRISLESTSTNASEDIGTFITQRRTRKSTRNSIAISVDPDGFKLPLHKRNSKENPALTAEMSSLRLSVDTNVSTDLKKVSLSTADTLSSLRLSSETYASSKKTSVGTQDSVPSLRVSNGDDSARPSSEGKRKTDTSADDSDSNKKVKPLKEATPTSKRQSKLIVDNKENKENTSVNKPLAESESSSDSNSDHSLKKTRRKLYNPNQSINDASILNVLEAERQAIEERKRFKAPMPLTPIVLSSRSSNAFKDRTKSFCLSSSEEKPKKKKPLKVPVVVQKPHRDSQLDYQKDLHDEFVDKKVVDKTPKKVLDKTPKKVVDSTPTRKSIRITKKPEKYSSQTSDESIDETLPIKPVVRRSTMDFAPSTERKKFRTPTPKKPTATIVCTRFHRNDVTIFQQIVKKLGKYAVENEVSDRTTHLVSYEPVRTINILRAMTRGLWVLKPEWIFQSLEHGNWLPEEEFEQTDFSAAVQHCRIERQSFGPLYSMDIFANCGSVYIAKGTDPRCSDLVDLVRLCKGKCVPIARNADIVVGEYTSHPEVVCVKETWILDSITLNKCKNVKNYLIKPAPMKRKSDHF